MSSGGEKVLSAKQHPLVSSGMPFGFMEKQMHY